MFGAIGVAWGTVAGAIVGVAANFLYNFRRTMPPKFSEWHYFRRNISDPLALAVPMILVIWLGASFHVALVWTIPAMALATIPSLTQAWRAYHAVRGDLSKASEGPMPAETGPEGETI